MSFLAAVLVFPLASAQGRGGGLFLRTLPLFTAPQSFGRDLVLVGNHAGESG